MPSSRPDVILDTWRIVTSAATLPPQAPTPTRRPLQIGLGAIAIATGTLVFALLRAPGGISPGSTPAGSGSEMPSTLVALTSPGPTITSIPTYTPALSPSAVPSEPAGPGGTCTASQFDLGKATNGWFYTTFVSQKNGVSQPFHNTGNACLLVLPATIFVARTGGEPVPVSVSIVDGKKSFSLGAGAFGTIDLTATWSTGYVAPGQTPEPCAGRIEGVTEVQVPVASGRVLINLGVTWREVCASPPSLTITVMR